MTEVLLLHHAQGRTPGVLALADDLRAAGHVVHVPDLYEGRTFDDLDAGVAHAREIGFDTVHERGRRAADGLSADLAYVGISLGLPAAQELAQTRPGARALVALHAFFPPAELGSPWPPGLPMQVHAMEGDDWADLDVAREVLPTVPGAELFVYPGDDHLFTDRSLPAYDEAAAGLVLERVLALLAAVG